MEDQRCKAESRLVKTLNNNNNNKNKIHGPALVLSILKASRSQTRAWRQLLHGGNIGNRICRGEAKVVLAPWWMLPLVSVETDRWEHRGVTSDWHLPKKVYAKNGHCGATPKVPPCSQISQLHLFQGPYPVGKFDVIGARNRIGWWRLILVLILVLTIV